ncbi:hypothetical protein Syun_013378 [Stephania yunnanensis]|uniref:DYW domain-containing protein n=1 Tax=Stephania yunnanensis TaxID=152371 RepID=A0AAP0PGH7_9MAGN
MASPSLHHLHQNPFINKKSRDIGRHERPGLTSVSSILTFSTTTETCTSSRKVESLNAVKQLHAQIVKMGDNLNSECLAEKLIHLYLKFGDFRSAAFVFFLGFLGLVNFSRPLRSVVEEFDGAGSTIFNLLVIFSELHRKGAVFDGRNLSVVIKICAESGDLWLGKEIHALLVKKGLDLDVHLKCALMSFYGNCWGVEFADQVFEEMPSPTIFLWNEAISVNLRSGLFAKALHFFREMQFSFVKANSFTTVKIIQVCGKLRALGEGKQIHGYVLRSALESNLLICNSLVNMYAKNSKLESARIVFDLIEKPTTASWNCIVYGYAINGFLAEARKLFQEMELSEAKPDVITWNSLLSGYLLHESSEKVLVILQKMQSAGFKPNSSSIATVLQAISDLGLLVSGKEVHGYVIRNGLEHDVYVGTSLIDMYLKCSSLSGAQAAFDYMKNKNVFAWNSIITGYAFNGHFDEAFKHLEQMKQEGINPDMVTWNGLVSGYSLRGHSNEAVALIRQMKTLGVEPNVVSWTALISGCCQTGNYKDSFRFFGYMVLEGIKPNSTTTSTLLRACAGMSLLQKGEEIHCLTIRNCTFEDPVVATSLIDMYCKSGSLKKALDIFRKCQKKGVASWNSMIMGLAIHGRGKEAISLFNEMCDAGIKPDSITFTAVLSGCKHSGLIDDGWKYFDSMAKDFNMMPTLEHYSCMVDLLGRCGYLDEAWDFIQQMPLEADAGTWGALLGACRIHKNLELAEIASKHLFKLEPYNSANYILMMNLYANANRWENVENLRDLMDAKSVNNRPGWSWIQIDEKIHVFSAVGKPHRDIGEIYYELYQLVSKIKKLGYVPDTSCVLQKTSEDEKLKTLLSHTEKLAITYGLIKKENYRPVRVISNTRVCTDCHTAAKHISEVSGREIILKDRVRFHHFSNGKCSCNDYW